MILFYELIQLGVSHAPFTHAFIQMAAHAFPNDELRIYAHQSHLDSALGRPDALLDNRLIKIPYVAPQLAGQQFRRRVMATLKLLKETWLPVAHLRPQVIFLSNESHHIWALKIFKLLHPSFRCHVVLHGDLNSIRSPRARNPFLRILDYTSSIGNMPNRDIRFIALETHIATNLANHIPSAKGTIDVIRHPCMLTDTPWRNAPLPKQTIRFGLLGIAGPSKGLDVFARMALRVSRQQTLAPEFRLVGKLQKGAGQLDLSGISGPLPFSHEWLSRELFEDEIAALHYVVLPYNMNYYGLSASGVLLDVLRWRKPVIALDTPVMRELADMFGDIGYICEDEEALIRTAEHLLNDFDPVRYSQQRDNLDAAHHSRLPESMAPTYRMLQSTCWKPLPTNQHIPS